MPLSEKKKKLIKIALTVSAGLLVGLGLAESDVDALVKAAEPVIVNLLDSILK